VLSLDSYMNPSAQTDQLIVYRPVTRHIFIVSLASLLLFLMIAYPMVYSVLYVKATLFGVLLLIAIIRVMQLHSIRVSPRIFFWSYFLCLMAAGYFIEGATQNIDYAYREGRVYFLWPMIYALLLVLISTAGDLRFIFKIVIFSSIYIGAYGLLYTLQTVGLIPQLEVINLLALNDVQAVGVHGNYMQVLISGLNSLPFLFPFVVTLIYVSYKSSIWNIGRVWLWLSLGLQLALILVSGRRALWVLIVITPIILYFATIIARQWSRKLIGYCVVVLLVVAGIGVGISTIKWGFRYNNVFTILMNTFKFTGTNDASNLIRAAQFDALIHGWSSAPIFGHGFGTFPSSYIRAPDMPWSYELYYMALLFHIGIVGILIYGVAILWLLRKAIHIARIDSISAWFALPAIMGLIGMLIATATNPYLDRFDGMWTVFILIAVINVFWMYGPSVSTC